MTGRLREATVGDAMAIAALHCSSFYRGWSSDEVRQLLSGSGGVGFIIDIEGKEAGFLLACSIIPEAEILSLVVDLAFRRCGLATDLLGALENELLLRACDKIFLEVAETNDAAIKLYERHSFKQVGFRPAYYQSAGDCRINALVLRKNLCIREI